ncbi:uncharacterized protein LOC135133841 [Zophobas morio]|uniref:uncharacterized protein LOC135133841 n=1 Tax=Zophobas morio TaxID=2755281 RepID=UPI003083E59C
MLSNNQSRDKAELLQYRRKDILLLESVQRRATRIPFGRVRPQYHERLAIMKILTLSNRRVRGDLITTFQAMSNKSSPIHKLFILSAHTLTRGHSFKLAKEKFKTTVRQHFLSNRVFQQWNSLPEEIVTPNRNIGYFPLTRRRGHNRRRPLPDRLT